MPLFSISGERSYVVDLRQGPTVPVDNVSRFVWNKLPNVPLTLGASNDIVVSMSLPPGGATLAAIAPSGVSTVVTGPGRDLSFADAGSQLMRGGAGHDVLASGADGDRLDGGPGDDFLLPGAGADLVTTGPGADIVAGTPAELAGDTVGDFGTRDQLLIAGASLRPQDVLFANGSLRIDGDGDGTRETTVRLVGRFRPDRFVVATVSGGSAIRHQP